MPNESEKLGRSPRWARAQADWEEIDPDEFRVAVRACDQDGRGEHGPIFFPILPRRNHAADHPV